MDTELALYHICFLKLDAFLTAIIIHDLILILLYTILTRPYRRTFAHNDPCMSWPQPNRLITPRPTQLVILDTLNLTNFLGFVSDTYSSLIVAVPFGAHYPPHTSYYTAGRAPSEHTHPHTLSTHIATQHAISRILTQQFTTARKMYKLEHRVDFDLG